MYKLLTHMPLLQGINGIELARIEERIGLQTEELAASRYPFITQGQPCREMVFLVGGTMTRQTVSADGLYTAIELCYSPIVIEPDKLYGLSCQYGSSYRSQTDCQLIRISKKQVGDHLLKSDIFRPSSSGNRKGCSQPNPPRQPRRYAASLPDASLTNRARKGCRSR